MDIFRDGDVDIDVHAQAQSVLDRQKAVKGEYPGRDGDMIKVGCGPKRKQRYRTRAIALMKAARSLSNGGPKLFIYKCALCKMWHLTHQPQGKSRE